jgi:hypothetical protein
MARPFNFSIFEFQKRLSVVQTYKDIENSDYLNRIIKKWIRFEQLHENFQTSKSPEEVKEWIFRQVAQKVNLKEIDLYKFIDKHYLQNGIGISEPFPEFFEKYVNMSEVACLTKMGMSKYLSILGIKAVKKRVKCGDKTQQMTLHVRYEDLLNAFLRIGIKGD